MRATSRSLPPATRSSRSAGSYGTLAEMALALRLGRTVVALEGAPVVDGAKHAASAADAVELALRDLG